MRKEEQAHEAVLAMLKNLEEKKSAPSRSPPQWARQSPLNMTMDGHVETDESPPLPQQVKVDSAGTAPRRSRRVGKFVEHLQGDEVCERTEEASEDEKAQWRLSRMGPKLVMYEPAPWEEEANAPATPTEPSATARDSLQPLEDIAEDDESTETATNQYVAAPDGGKPRLLTPPIEKSLPSPHSSHFSMYKHPSDTFPAPPTPRSARIPISPTTDFAEPKSPTRSFNQRGRPGLKKIFLSSLRPRKRDDEPLSPSPTLSSAATTPSLPTPTIRITSPFHPRRFDGSPLCEEELGMGKLSPIETSYRLPELRLSRADWGEWGRRIAESL